LKFSNCLFLNEIYPDNFESGTFPVVIWQKTGKSKIGVDFHE